MIDRKTFWSMKKLSKLFSSIENIEINRRSNEKMRQILLNQSSKNILNVRVRAVVAHLASQSKITYDFYLSNQNCKAEWTRFNVAKIAKIRSLSQ